MKSAKKRKQETALRFLGAAPFHIQVVYRKALRAAFFGSFSASMDNALLASKIREDQIN